MVNADFRTGATLYGIFFALSAVACVVLFLAIGSSYPPVEGLDDVPRLILRNAVPLLPAAAFAFVVFTRVRFGDDVRYAGIAGATASATLSILLLVTALTQLALAPEIERFGGAVIFSMFGAAWMSFRDLI